MITCVSSAGATSVAVDTGALPAMAVQRRGRGQDIVLFHGGMGWWKHWVRNVGPLAERFADLARIGMIVEERRNHPCSEHLRFLA